MGESERPTVAHINWIFRLKSEFAIGTIEPAQSRLTPVLPPLSGRERPLTVCNLIPCRKSG
jgi:hypothetical protein